MRLSTWQGAGVAEQPDPRHGANFAAPAIAVGQLHGTAVQLCHQGRRARQDGTDVVPCSLCS